MPNLNLFQSVSFFIKVIKIVHNPETTGQVQLTKLFNCNYAHNAYINNLEPAAEIARA